MLAAPSSTPGPCRSHRRTAKPTSCSASRCAWSATRSAPPSTGSSEERHYLASARLAGQTLRYVAELDGQWVALLTFSAAALHFKAREARLGWTPRQRARRLGLIVYNSRFLVLPERARYATGPPGLRRTCRV